MTTSNEMDNVCKPKKKNEYISLVFLSALFPFSHKKVYFLELDFKTITIYC